MSMTIIVHTAILTRWAITSVETYQRLVTGVGWTAVRYKRWLGDVLVAQFLSDVGPTG
jgi:hypothetical protein